MTTGKRFGEENTGIIRIELVEQFGFILCVWQEVDYTLLRGVNNGQALDITVDIGN